MPIDEVTDLEQVVVLRGDLETWISALWQAHNCLEAQDIAKGYKDLRPNAPRSKLTNVLANAYNRAEGYLPKEEDDGTLSTV